MAETTFQSPEFPARPTPHRSPTDTLMLERVREMSAQRRALQEAHQLVAKERQLERRWKRLFQGLFFGGPFVTGLLYFLFFLKADWFRFGPLKEVVGVVHIDGEIAAGTPAGADKVIPALERAFESDNVKAVVLAIDSPGGAPVEAERIYKAMAVLKTRHNEPLVAVINNVGASAAYLVARHADQVVAGNTVWWGRSGPSSRRGSWIAPSASGRRPSVSMPAVRSNPSSTPLRRSRPPWKRRPRPLVDPIGKTFVADLEAVRGGKLQAGVNYGTGEPWSAIEAKERGRVDTIGTIDSVVDSRWSLKRHDFGPRRDGGFGTRAALRDAMAGAIDGYLARQAFQVR